METIVLLLAFALFFVSIYAWNKRTSYKKLYLVSNHLLLAHYTEEVLKKLIYLQKIQLEDYYTETFSKVINNLQEKLLLLPKDIQCQVWKDAVTKHDSTQPRAKSSDGVWGRASWYNEIKSSLNISD